MKTSFNSFWRSCSRLETLNILKSGFRTGESFCSSITAHDFDGGLFLFCSGLWDGLAAPDGTPRCPGLNFKPASEDGEEQANLSFGSETGRTRSGTKGVSGKAKKKLKRKKQEYHMHRGHFHEEEQVSPEQVRARTVLALDRLGHQVLSTEPGGYDLEAWVRSLNSLLDDFEEKIGEEKVTDEFRKAREGALAPLLSRSVSGDVDSEIRKLVDEEADQRARLSELDRQSSSEARIAEREARRQHQGAQDGKGEPFAA